MTSLNPLYTVGEQLLEVLKIHKNLDGDKALKTAIEAFDAVQIPDAKARLNNYPHEFSGGMKQRVIIAMALACKPELIIADEPTTALDVTIQKQIMDLIQELQKELQTTIILISHDLALVSNYADTVNVMYSGRVTEKANSKEFFENPMHPYSAALINSLPSANAKGKLNTINGAPPNIREKISGCKFHLRCERFEKGLCDKEIPELREKSANHFAACFKI
jgi:oligopeptide/dipeptide ABC transporter ATP-binding protein